MTDEQRRQGCPAGDLCIELLRRDTTAGDSATGGSPRNGGWLDLFAAGPNDRPDELTVPIFVATVDQFPDGLLPI